MSWTVTTCEDTPASISDEYATAPLRPLKARFSVSKNKKVFHGMASIESKLEAQSSKVHPARFQL